ncbi:TBCD protein [Punctularia strigosozonata HHB-11173 SS5]|uniref:TBCD protein n=1 Tax=Punctularia strigosozonata (strain HHB-11173) TaxID=741275 RepID=UPI0004417E60|nr:TBCD protein [Punctularia strigosozonata HHB-11173 SS5]EIN12617.1 TBCD protein [Punctularia strigosozonata HHB-11173 SS5]
METDASDARLLSTFEKHGEFVGLQDRFLASDLWALPSPEDDHKDTVTLVGMLRIFNEYQEQPYLLDPFLESLVTPVVQKLRSYARQRVRSPNAPRSLERVNRLATLIYNYTKFRGYKTIIRFFPHEVADLSVAIGYMRLHDETQGPNEWALRYVVLLWLSLVCMIPFDLAQFDEDGQSGKTARTVESIGKDYLGKAGIDRDAAALLLSRLYMRKDTRSMFSEFLQWAGEGLAGSTDAFMCTGILRTVCEIGKSGPVEEIREKTSELLDLARVVQGRSSAMANTIIRKLRVKLLSRIALRTLPGKARRNRNKGRVLVALEDDATAAGDVELLEDPDTMDIVESVLDDHFSALQDKDTIVRWSAAKGVARISERLPTDFSDQVLRNILGLFEIHSMAAATIYDMSSIAEATWHGACLASAEMARRGCVADYNVGELIEWMFKALYFDIRKGAHSVGSNVRDAACYVIWSLARTQDTLTLRAHCNALAFALVQVALFDREVHIRRAASAAFQEHVGRTGLFPHGIDVLRKTDFYAVGIRRNAFLVAAPEVAEHSEYRPSLINHLHAVTLRHWDPAMRVLGARALRIICEVDLPTDGPSSRRRAAELLDSPDNTDVHGGLLALAELAAAFDQAGLFDEKRETFACLALAPADRIMSSRHEDLTAAACTLIGSSISIDEIQLGQATRVPHWRKILDFGLKHRSVAVQEESARAMASVSHLVDCSAIVTRLIEDCKRGSPTTTEGVTRLMGFLDYEAYSHSLLKVVQFLLNVVSPENASTVEARRNAFTSMHQLLSKVSPCLAESLGPSITRRMFDALYAGLDDYTIDERGDVGSWIRMACMDGLTAFAESLMAKGLAKDELEQYLPPDRYHLAVAGILKQGMERLDNVRACAGADIVKLLNIPVPSVLDGEAWRLKGEQLMKELFLGDEENVRWSDGEWLYPRAVQLLQIKEYRSAILDGLVVSIASRTDSTQRTAALSLRTYVQRLPVTASDPDSCDICGLCERLAEKAKQNATSNLIVIPLLQTFQVLFEADVLVAVAQSARGLRSLQTLLDLVTKNVSRLKSIQRIIMSMKTTVNLLTVPAIFDACVALLPRFLSHPVPKVRADTAEYLYLFLQSNDVQGDTEEIENLLLETEWTLADMSVTRDTSEKIVALLSGDP